VACVEGRARQSPAARAAIAARALPGIEALRAIMHDTCTPNCAHCRGDVACAQAARSRASLVDRSPHEALDPGEGEGSDEGCQGYAGDPGFHVWPLRGKRGSQALAGVGERIEAGNNLEPLKPVEQRPRVLRAAGEQQRSEDYREQKVDLAGVDPGAHGQAHGTAQH